jgi:predicted nucleic acid-binding Zn ribbon protein
MRQSALVLKDFELPPYGEVMATDRESMTPLKDIISNLLRDGGLPFNPDDANIWKVWDDVVGAAISKNAQPSWIKTGRLRVIVSDPIWLQELDFLEESIREKLNERLGRNAVEKIDFRVGPR